MVTGEAAREATMTIGFIYWLLLLIAMILGCFWRWWAPNEQPYLYPAAALYLLVLLVLLGIGTFGWPIRE